MEQCGALEVRDDTGCIEGKKWCGENASHGNERSICPPVWMSEATTTLRTSTGISHINIPTCTSFPLHLRTHIALPFLPLPLLYLALLQPLIALLHFHLVDSDDTFDSPNPDIRFLFQHVNDFLERFGPCRAFLRWHAECVLFALYSCYGCAEACFCLREEEDGWLGRRGWVERSEMCGEVRVGCDVL